MDPDIDLQPLRTSKKKKRDKMCRLLMKANSSTSILPEGLTRNVIGALDPAANVKGARMC